MSVYTVVSEEALTAFLARYSVGRLLAFRGIAAGITNTNYFVTTEAGRWVLTLTESLGLDELPYFLALKYYLSERGIACPAPQQQRGGAWASLLCGKPACLVSVLPGSEVLAPNPAQCRAIGKMLAKMHLAGADFPERMPNPRGAAWWEAALPKVLPKLSAQEAALLQNTVDAVRAAPLSDLPHGVIHADLFRDNVLFHGDEVGGVIDFYYACDGAWLYDLAICANDWCSEADGRLHSERLAALWEGYQSVRRLSAAEEAAWPQARRAAALRFWMSRLLDYYYPPEGELTFIKDPQVFRQILEQI